MTPNRKIPWFLPLILLMFVGYSGYRIWPGSPGAPPVTITFKGSTMGTTYLVKLVGATLSPQERSELAVSIENRLDAINQMMSTYLPASELSLLNANPTTEPVRVAKETFEVLKLAEQVSQSSNGAFDVTVGPLVNAWGFGPKPRQPLSNELLTQLRARVGYQMLKLDPKTRTVAKSREDLSIDLSAIAKGYAVDQLGLLLKKAGHTNRMVEIGGEIAVSGINATGSPWRLGIEKPSPGGRRIQEILSLNEGALATSGDYRNFVEIEGQRYSHTLDPRTGAPVLHQLASVSVVALDCASADAYATALNVLGESAGFDLAISLNLAAFFIIRQPNGTFSTKVTPEFEKYRAIMGSEPQGK